VDHGIAPDVANAVTYPFCGRGEAASNLPWLTETISVPGNRISTVVKLALPLANRRMDLLAAHRDRPARFDPSPCLPALSTAMSAPASASVPPMKIAEMTAAWIEHDDHGVPAAGVELQQERTRRGRRAN
jgi:hypothetical protein